MAYLLDTDVVIHLRDGNNAIQEQARALDPPLLISIISRVELENGVHRDRHWATERRMALDIILARLSIVEFGADEFSSYRSILVQIGYSRRKTSDRMIAATAIAHDLTLVTMNADDYGDVPGLKLISW